MAFYRIARFNRIPDAAWFLSRKAREYQEHDDVRPAEMLFVGQGSGGMRSIAARLVKHRIRCRIRQIGPDDAAIRLVSDLGVDTVCRQHCFAMLSAKLGDRMVPFCRFLQNDIVNTTVIAVCLDAHDDCDALAFHLGAEVSPLIDSLEPGVVYFQKVDGIWCCRWPDRPTWLVPRLLVEICDSLCVRQRAFFEGGIEQLTPLKQSDVAADVGCHLSSVSRLIAGVEAQMEWGRLPLKSLFAGAIKADSGLLSQTQAKAAVLQAIRNEDGNRPLSDDAITAALRSHGLQISRRTVTKYRIALGVPSTRERGKQSPDDAKIP